MQTDLKVHLSDVFNGEIKKISAVQGGDISSAYKLETEHQTYFVKVNNSAESLNMFKIEAKGLKLIHQTNTIKTPKVIGCDSFKNLAFLILEFIEAKHASTADFKNLGIQLAQLHRCTTNQFGLEHHNFIGKLTQRNTPHQTWIGFYIQQRLLPQLKLAQTKSLLGESEIPSRERLYNSLNALFENIKPALLHGDLWSGNYLISKDGTPYLIDPAVYYGHNEVDIAMTKLFGGFDTPFYEAYTSVIPFDNTTSYRIDIYQLYYLLVHLNMFGSSYYPSVSAILKKYF